ncbi:hypothetical protein MRS76_24235 [Rhizobiaceae bacterium n13]|uniref:Uncharacterized protein n=1 Tax=Ferirhizobium litorale TaxID=2927786 RepID=A0AAE3QL69_9HYPH|nr:hypothetical protein [Fererhizobium litorale]MDI7865030.1 hypothetical protein [Fererhizobium litorale]MDI7925204.1 hypothetical protein [Fererhizobium litorale]
MLYEHHMEPPIGISHEMHLVNLCLTAVALRIHANLRWLDREDPNIAEARRTSAKLVEHINHLETLIAKLNEATISSD